MSAKKEQDEPTMEEILASIRRIISEESEPEQPEQANQAKEQAKEQAREQAREQIREAIAAKPEPEEIFAAELEDDVLELTEIVEDEPEPAESDFSFDDLVAEMTPAAEAADEISLDDELSSAFPEPEPAAEFPTPEPLIAGTDRGPDSVDPADERDAIMSDAPAAEVRASFGQLSDLLVAGYAGADKTLEGMVREMLKPMLKTWLDQNLPEIVERTVAREVARLARVKKP